MASPSEHPALGELHAQLEQEEEAYAAALAALDALAGLALPAETAPDLRDVLVRLNTLWSVPEAPSGTGLANRLRRRLWGMLRPAFERQSAFNATLVQLLNARLAESDLLHARLRELAGALVRYAQRVQPLLDARARVAAALATTHSELVLESFGRDLESHGRRLEGLSALRDRIEALSAGLTRDSSPTPPTEGDR